MVLTTSRKVALLGFIITMAGSVIVLFGVRDEYGSPIEIYDLGWVGFALFGVGILIAYLSSHIKEPDVDPEAIDFPSLKPGSFEKPKKLPFLSYEAEMTLIENQHEGVLEWSFKGLREAQLILNGRLVASLKPVGIMGFNEYGGSYDGIKIIFRRRTNWSEGRNDIAIIVHESGEVLGGFRTDTGQDPSFFLTKDAKEYILRGGSEGGTPIWSFFANDRRMITMTKADFNKPKYTFRALDIEEKDPNRWLLAVISLYNILRYNFPS